MNLRRPLILILPVLLVAGGCTEADGPRPVVQTETALDADAEVARLLAEGKDWLARAEPHEASLRFREILTDYDAEHLEARFGYGLCKVADSVELVTMLVGVVTGALGMTAPSPEGVAPPPPIAPPPEAPPGLSENEYVAWLLRDTLGRLSERLGEAASHLDVAQAAPELVFRLERDGAPAGLQIYVNAKLAIELGPELDAADAGFLAYLARVLRGVIDLLVAQGLESDVMGIVAAVENGTLGDLDGAAISRIVAYLMNFDPRFLALAPGGEEALGRMAAEWAEAQDDFLRGLELLRAETDDQDDDAIVLRRVGTGRNARDAVIVRGLWDEERQDFDEMRITMAEEMPASLAAIRDNLRGTGGRLAWGADVLPVLSSLLLSLVQMGILEVLGLELPQDLLDSFVGMTPEDFGDFTLTLIPDALELDLGTALGVGANPAVGLRAVLPAWTTGRPRWENGLVLSYECLDDLDDQGFPSGSLGLLCHEDAELTDADHFTGTPYAAAADRVKGKLPYFQWPDPSWNGLIRLDMSKANILLYGAEPGYKDPDNRDLNAYLQKVVKSILFLAGQ